jgi:hypothetical protein
MQTKTLASLKHAHIGPALAMIALAVAALGLSACGRVVPKPPKAAKETQSPATINLTSKALRGPGDYYCYDLTAKAEKNGDKEEDKTVKDLEICIFGTDTDGLYNVVTNLDESALNNAKVAPVAEETATPVKKLSLDTSVLAAAAEAPKGEAKKEEKKPDHAEKFAKATLIPADAEKNAPAKIEIEKDGDKAKISLEFLGSLTEDASKRKKEVGTVIISGKKYKYSRSKI